ncbi:BglG family transcription antiterminator LicT [Paenibacillus camerounensis]|uniref:BglG family transcription antiterminator LicT n=1 Tax=Paenibacillus camerounensis TaxID=1243663 RepID=UPI0005AB2D4C|nr:PRD domain-containing protein [Paenibacillus camerounensis]
MRIIKKLNNSVVIAKDERDNEVVVMGKGIGCNYPMGTVLSRDDFERVFVLEDQKTTRDVISMSGAVPEIYFDISSRIITYARDTMNLQLNEHLYVALTDHLYFAAQRYKEQLVVQNRLLWEVKKFYPREFKVGLFGLGVIYEELNILFPEEEAGNIAFHLANAQYSPEGTLQSVRTTTAIKDIMSIVSYHFGITLDDDSLNYSRFVTHLQFFAQRLMDGIKLESDDGFLFEQVKSTYYKEFECALRIEDYIKLNFSTSLSKSELIYLTIHIHRVVNRS